MSVIENVTSSDGVVVQLWGRNSGIHCDLTATPLSETTVTDDDGTDHTVYTPIAVGDLTDTQLKYRAKCHCPESDIECAESPGYSTWKTKIEAGESLIEE